MTLPESTVVNLIRAVIEFSGNCSRENKSKMSSAYTRLVASLEQAALHDTQLDRYWRNWLVDHKSESDIVVLLAGLSQYAHEAFSTKDNCNCPDDCESSYHAADEMSGIDLLRHVIHVAMRLVTLENRYSADLEAANRRVLYNMAYGLSHELNNPLAIISANASQLLRNESDSKRRQGLETIIDSASRGHEMIADVMYTARLPAITPQTIVIRAFLDAFIAKCRRWSSACSIDLTCPIDDDLTWEFDSIALTEALWALVRNAIEASGEDGSIHIAVQLQDDSASLMFVVDDTGCGLSRQGLEHCFDPYYCGKEAGRNLGVGLFKARRICELHGGSLQLENLAVGGCRASVVLPKVRRV